VDIPIKSKAQLLPCISFSSPKF